MIIHGYIPKSKKRKVPKAIKIQYEQWLAEITKPFPKFARTASGSSKKEFSMANLHSKKFIRETPYIPSKNPEDFSPATKKDNFIYTGNKIIGIGTLHKSNAVPVFNNDEAKDMAKMRR